MRIPPPEVILSWPPPRYDNPETRGPANEIITLILLATATTVIAIRTYTRKWIIKGFGWEDILIILAFIPATGFVVVGMISMDRYGWGRHVWDVPVDRFTGSLQMGLASQILFDLATSFTKLSMLALIYRIAHEASRKFSFLVIGLEAFIATNGVIFMLVAMLQCRPLSLYWTLSLEPQNCINEAAHLLVAGIINTVTDFVVVLLPLTLVRIVYKNKLSSRQMVIVNLLFGTGFLASFAGAARTYFTWVVTTEPDVTWNAWMNWLMASLELFLGIICTSIPSTKPFFNRYLPRLLSSRSHKSQGTGLPSPSYKTAKESQMVSELTFDTDLETSFAMPVEFSTTTRTPTPTAPAAAASAAATQISRGALNKPLPAVMRKSSVYTINIQLDEASLSPADRRDRLWDLDRDLDRDRQQINAAPAIAAIHNFSRPKAPHLSMFSTRDVNDRTSRYSQAIDEIVSSYGRQSIDDAETDNFGTLGTFGAFGALQSSYGNCSEVTSSINSFGAWKFHTKNSSVGTFGA